ncbi:MAG: cation:dicarboxylase symporter family transporter, partial [Sphingomonadales bacterium]
MLSLPLRMFLALVIGLGGGMAMAALAGPGLSTMLAIARPIGSLWLDALTMTIVPLVFGLIVNGIAAATREASASKVALRSIICFAALLTIAAALSAAVTTGILHYWPISEQAGALRGAALPPVEPLSQSTWYQGIIPTNPIKAAAETAMVPLVVFALLFGFALTRIEAPLRASVLTFTEALVQTMLVII